jgi:hypothetical protein
MKVWRRVVANETPYPNLIIYLKRKGDRLFIFYLYSKNSSELK